MQIVKKIYRFIRKKNFIIKNKNIDNYVRKAYSQDGEDIVLETFLRNSLDGQNGFYVDIGAHHPRRFSNTKIFYDLGWKGINIDATPGSIELFNKERQRDINLEIAIGNDNEFLDYYLFDEPALNSFDKELSDNRIKNGWKLKDIKKIQTNSINTILQKHLSKDKKITFITIDIEGLELDILSSFDYENFAPLYFLIEELDINNEDFSKISNSQIYKLLKTKGYIPVAKTWNSVIYRRESK